MRLRLFARFRRSARQRPARSAGQAPWAEPPSPGQPTGGRHRRDGTRPPEMTGPPPERTGPPPQASGPPWEMTGPPATGPRPAGDGPAGPEASPFGSPVGDVLPRRQPKSRPPGTGQGATYPPAAARAAVRMTPGAEAQARPEARAAQRRPQAAAETGAAGTGAAGSGLPWYEVAHARRAAEGRRDCGELEDVLCREWAEGTVPPPEAVRAVDRLADLPSQVKAILVRGLDAIFVGPGGVPDLDDMAKLHGVPLPSGRATWDACAGAYGERKIIVGSRRSAAPDVMCHEIGHALDDIDGSGGMWQSDSDEFRRLYDRCLPRLVSYFHRQEGAIGRREFFADAFAAI